MAALLVVCLAAALVGAVITRVGRGPRPALASSGRIACGVERWAVKTLTDPGARLVNFRPRPTTVSTLRRLRPTGTYARGKGVERRTYRVRARLVESRLEDDQDFHLVIVDLRYPSRTMIVEFPDPACTRHAVQKRRLQMQSARSRFINACGFPSSSSFDRLRGTASIIGVGFFDFIHGQAGVAPNGIELHPVLLYEGQVLVNHMGWLVASRTDMHADDRARTQIEDWCMNRSLVVQGAIALSALALAGAGAASRPPVSLRCRSSPDASQSAPKQGLGMKRSGGHTLEPYGVSRSP